MYRDRGAPPGGRADVPVLSTDSSEGTLPHYGGRLAQRNLRSPWGSEIDGSDGHGDIDTHGHWSTHVDPSRGLHCTGAVVVRK